MGMESHVKSLSVIDLQACRCVLAFMLVISLHAVPCVAFQTPPPLPPPQAEVQTGAAPFRPSPGEINPAPINIPAVPAETPTQQPGPMTQQPMPATNQPILGVQQPIPVPIQSLQETQTQFPNPGSQQPTSNQRFSSQSTLGQPLPNQSLSGQPPSPLQNPTQGGSPKPGITRVTQDLSKLPNSAGQVWREYDITPYTSQISSTKDPQKAILDWVLRETGNAMWFNEPLGILSIDKSRLYVYHTPEIQSVVKRIVDRFIRTRAQLQTININMVTVENPNWRSAAYTMLQPIDVQSPGMEAWMISKENAAQLLGQLGKRTDFKQHTGGRLTNHDGQPFVIEKTRPVQFVRSLRWVPNQNPNYQPLMTSLNEGYKLEIACLSSINNDSIEAVIKCEIDQVEKLNTVIVNVPGLNGAAQQMHLQIPQLVSWRLHERFKWPNDQVLLLSCGVVATLDPEAKTGGFKIPGLPQAPKRSDALLFIEYRGPAMQASVPRTAQNRLAPIRPEPARQGQQ